MRALSRSFDHHVSGQKGVALRALIVLAIAVACLFPLLD